MTRKNKVREVLVTPDGDLFDLLEEEFREIDALSFEEFKVYMDFRRDSLTCDHRGGGRIFPELMLNEPGNFKTYLELRSDVIPKELLIAVCLIVIVFEVLLLPTWFWLTL